MKRKMVITCIVGLLLWSSAITTVYAANNAIQAITIQQAENREATSK